MSEGSSGGGSADGGEEAVAQVDSYMFGERFHLFLHESTSILTCVCEGVKHGPINCVAVGVTSGCPCWLQEYAFLVILYVSVQNINDIRAVQVLKLKKRPSTCATVSQDCIFQKEAGFSETNWHSDLRMTPLDTNHSITAWIPLRPIASPPSPELGDTPLCMLWPLALFILLCHIEIWLVLVFDPIETHHPPALSQDHLCVLCCASFAAHKP